MSDLNLFLNQVKPEPKEGQKICDGCWKQSSDTTFWLWMNFKHLSPTLLCEDCAEKRKTDLQKMQSRGL